MRGSLVEQIIAALEANDCETTTRTIQNFVIAKYGGVPRQYASERTFRQSIQRVIEDHCPDAKDFDGRREGLFERVGKGIYRLIGARKLRWLDHTISSTEEEQAEDIASIYVEHQLVPTARKALIEARIGQGVFRKQVLDKWNKACAVTGCQLVHALRASHIKPWRDSTDLERLDPNNGLPLVATLDALFDRGLISFANDGTLILAAGFPERDRSILKIENLRLRFLPCEATSAYLSEHRKRHRFVVGTALERTAYPTGGDPSNS